MNSHDSKFISYENEGFNADAFEEVTPASPVTEEFYKSLYPGHARVSKYVKNPTADTSDGLEKKIIQKKAFILQFNLLLNGLKNWAIEHKCDHSLAIEDYREKFFLDSFSETQPESFFDFSKHALENIYYLLLDETQPVITRKAKLSAVCHGFGMCAPGSLAHLSDTLEDWLNVKSFAGWNAKIRREITLKLASKYIIEYNIPDNMQSHVNLKFQSYAFAKGFAPFTLTQSDAVDDPFTRAVMLDEKNADPIQASFARARLQEFIIDFIHLYKTEYITRFEEYFSSALSTIPRHNKDSEWIDLGSDKDFLGEANRLLKSLSLDEHLPSFYETKSDIDSEAFIVKYSKKQFRLALMQYCFQQKKMFAESSHLDFALHEEKESAMYYRGFNQLYTTNFLYKAESEEIVPFTQISATHLNRLLTKYNFRNNWDFLHSFKKSDFEAISEAEWKILGEQLGKTSLSESDTLILKFCQGSSIVTALLEMLITVSKERFSALFYHVRIHANNFYKELLFTAIENVAFHPLVPHFLLATIMDPALRKQALEKIILLQNLNLLKYVSTFTPIGISDIQFQLKSAVLANSLPILTYLIDVLTKLPIPSVTHSLLANHPDNLLHLAAENNSYSLIPFLAHFIALSAVHLNETPLVVATRKGHLASVRELARLTSNKESINSTLTFAAKYGQQDVFRMLVAEFKADISSLNEKQQDVLTVAILSDQPKMVKMLVNEFKFSVESKDHEGFTPLMLATYYNRVATARLLAKELKADINATNSNGATALMYAASLGHTLIVKMLITECKADINAVNSAGDSAMHFAAANNHVDTLRCMITSSKGSLDCKNKFGKTPLTIAIIENKIAAVKMLIQEFKAHANELHNPIIAAIETNNIDMIRMLHTELKLPLFDSTYNALHYAVKLKNIGLARAFVVEFNMNPNSLHSSSSGTPLYSAIVNEDLAMIRMLAPLSDLTRPSGIHKFTPFMLASQLGNVEVIKILALEFKANIEERDAHGVTPLINAIIHNRIEVVSILIRDCGANVESIHHLGATPLIVACIYNRFNMVKILIRDGLANANAMDATKFTPLHYSVLYQNNEIANLLVMEAKVDANTRDIFNKTPLMYAAETGNIDMIKLLVEHGKAEVNATLPDGLTTAMVLASNHNHFAATHLLSTKYQATLTVDNSSYHQQSTKRLRIQTSHDEFLQIYLKDRLLTPDQAALLTHEQRQMLTCTVLLDKLRNNQILMDNLLQLSSQQADALKAAFYTDAFLCEEKSEEKTREEKFISPSHQLHSVLTKLKVRLNEKFIDEKIIPIKSLMESVKSILYTWDGKLESQAILCARIQRDILHFSQPDAVVTINALLDILRLIPSQRSSFSLFERTPPLLEELMSILQTASLTPEEKLQRIHLSRVHHEAQHPACSKHFKDISLALKTQSPLEMLLLRKRLYERVPVIDPLLKRPAA